MGCHDLTPIVLEGGLTCKLFCKQAGGSAVEPLDRSTCETYLLRLNLII